MVFFFSQSLPKGFPRLWPLFRSGLHSSCAQNSGPSAPMGGAMPSMRFYGECGGQLGIWRNAFLLPERDFATSSIGLLYSCSHLQNHQNHRIYSKKGGCSYDGLAWTGETYRNNRRTAVPWYTTIGSAPWLAPGADTKRLREGRRVGWDPIGDLVPGSCRSSRHCVASRVQHPELRVERKAVIIFYSANAFRVTDDA